LLAIGNAGSAGNERERKADVYSCDANNAVRSVGAKSAASRFSMRVFFSAEEMKGNVFFVPDDPAVMPRWNVK
jgi:hypothetical protein